MLPYWSTSFGSSITKNNSSKNAQSILIKHKCVTSDIHSLRIANVAIDQNGRSSTGASCGSYSGAEAVLAAGAEDET